jgi:hypothetical protein
MVSFTEPLCVGHQDEGRSELNRCGPRTVKKNRVKTI